MSSYPACLAVKAAERQGAHHGEQLLRRLREAVMLQARNIARREVLLAVAQEMAADDTAGQAATGAGAGFDPAQFAADLDDPAVLAALRADIQGTRYREIGRFPALVLRHVDGQAVLLVGYRPYDALRRVVARLAPEVTPQRTAAGPIVYARYWGRITAREMAEAVALPQPLVAQTLDQAVAAGQLLQRDGLYSTATAGEPSTHPAAGAG